MQRTIYFGGSQEFLVESNKKTPPGNEGVFLIFNIIFIVFRGMNEMSNMQRKKAKAQSIHPS